MKGDGPEAEETIVQVEDGESVAGKDDSKKDWRWPIIEYIKDPSSTRDRKTQTILEIYYESEHMLKCLDEEQARVAMGEVHKGLCRTHQSTRKREWTLKRLGLYWPMMMDDYTRYRKG
jgi:hypothetical protein